MTREEVINTTQSPTYLTIQDVAHRYQLHRETVRRWILQGRLPAVKLAGTATWRIRAADLEAVERRPG